VGVILMVASPIAKRVAKGRRLAFLGLASANVALVLALAGPSARSATWSPR